MYTDLVFLFSNGDSTPCVSRWKNNELCMKQVESKVSFSFPFLLENKIISLTLSYTVLH